jgi:hypothetical protein
MSAALTVALCLTVQAAQAVPRSMVLDGQQRSELAVKAVPGQLNYQGFLADAADSSAVTATVEMTFRLFDSETKGAELWSETHPAVEVSGGLFQVFLGSQTPFPPGLFDGTPLWLQTEVGPEILTPRRPLVSAAYSHRSNSAEMLLSHTLTDLDDRWVNEDQAGSVTSDMITDGEIADADIAPGAAIAPDKIDGTAWTADNDGDGSGLNADMVDGHQASEFIAAEDLDHLDAADGDPVDAVYVDDDGKVGIGTTGPLTELEVNGAVTATTYFGDGSNLTGISGTADTDWTIAGSDMYSAVSGDVGIGLTNPGAKLHVVGSTGNYATIATSTYGVYGRHVGGDNYGYLGSSAYGVYGKSNTSGHYGYLGSGSYGVYGHCSVPKDDSGLPTASSAVYGEAQGTGASGVYGINTDSGNYGVIGHPDYAGYFDGDVHVTGDVGIGATSPAQELHIEGDFPQIHMYDPSMSTEYFTIGAGGGGFSFDDHLLNEPFFFPYGTPTATLIADTSGGITLGSWNPARAGLEIYTDIDDYELWLTELGTTGSDHAQIFFDSDQADWDLGVNSGTGIFYLYDPVSWKDAIRVSWDADSSEYEIWLNDDVFVGDDFLVSGTKSFVQEDPADPSRTIVYACLEGPEAGTYQRGVGHLVGGRAMIELPDHFAKVTADQGLTVQLTPVGEWLQLYVIEKSPDRIVVAEASGREGSFDYLIQGVRKGYENYQVVRGREEIPGLGRQEENRTIQGGPSGTESQVSADREVTRRRGNKSQTPLGRETEE